MLTNLVFSILTLGPALDVDEPTAAPPVTARDSDIPSEPAPVDESAATMASEDEVAEALREEVEPVGAEPASSMEPEPAATEKPQRLLDDLDAAVQGAALVQLIDHYANEARRERIVGGSLGLAASGLQLGIGIYGRVALADAGSGMQRSATSQILAGAVGMVSAVTQLAVRSPLERMRRSPSYAQLQADLDDTSTYESLRSDWQEAAKKGRRRRYIFGGIGLGLGAVLTTIASLRLADSGVSSGERIWAFTTLGTAVGTVFGGLASMILPSASERSLAAVEAARINPQPQIGLSPSVGGMVLHGRFYPVDPRGT